MKRVLYFFSLVIFGLFCGVTAYGENIYVEDHADVLSAETKKEINQYNQKYKELELRPQLAVVTLSELPEGKSIESYANEKFNELGVGDEEHDSGVLYVIAVKDRKQRIEVGYGLEETIPDALAMDLMTEEAKEKFREENYDAGVSIVAANINDVLAGNKTVKDFSPGIFAGLSFWEIITERIGPVIFVLGVIYTILSGPIDKTYVYIKERRVFAKDLKKELAPISTDYENYSTGRLLRSKDKQILLGREKLLKRHSKKKVRRRPAYYDFAFAFGTLTYLGFLMKRKAMMENYSVYYHNREMWASSSSSSDGGSGGGDSWGGGSSGGGGASSDW